MTKTYRVSLAVKQPMNYNIEIEANSPKEAIDKAIEEFRENSIDGDFEDYGESPEEDFDADSIETTGIDCQESE